jgi:hypothetical protein
MIARRIKLLIALTAVWSAGLFSSCSDPNRQKIVGRWRLQESELLTGRLDDNPTSDDDQPESDPILESRNQMTIEFERSGVLRTSTRIGKIDREKIGRWKLVRYDSADQILNVQCTLGLQTTEHEIQLIDENTIELVPPNMAGLRLKLRFQRARD